MTRRRRQGWRLPTAAVQLAVAGFLSVSGTPLLTESGKVFAQVAAGDRPKSPPPVGADKLPRPSAPQPLQPVARSPLTPTAAPAKPVPQVDPAQPAVPTAVNETPPLLILPTPPSIERLVNRRNSLNQVLFRDRRHQLLLSRGQAALFEANEAVAVEHFQALVDATCDAFIWPTDAAHPVGAQDFARRRLKELTNGSRSTYEQTYGDEARALLIEGVKSGDYDRVLELLRRFSHTEAGRESLTHELLRSHDMGLRVHCAQVAQRLVDNPDHWQRLSPRVQSIARRALDLSRPACAQTSDNAPADVSPPALRPTWSYHFCKGIQTEAARKSTLPIESIASIEDISQEDGRVSSERLSAVIGRSLHEWWTDHESRHVPVATANHAQVFDDLVVVRDFAGLRAMRLRDGRQQWFFECAGSLANVAADNLKEENRGGGPLPVCFQRHFAGHGPRGQVSSDGRLVFLIDDDLSKRCNRIVAIRLHPESPLPAPVWTQPQRNGEHTLAGHCFLGGPLEVDGRLFVLSEVDSRIECLSLNAADGHILWRQPIALTEQSIEFDTLRLQIAHSPIYAASTIVCPTEVGVIVGVDPLTGVLRWVYDHIDDDQRQAAGRWSSNSQRNYGSTELPSRMLISNGRVIHLPFRSQYVHCLDAATGAPIWKVERDGGLALTAATDRVVLMIGPRDVTALSLEDGSVCWRTECTEPSGHGVITNCGFLLPVADGRCLTFSLSDGLPLGDPFGKLLHELTGSINNTPNHPPSVIQLASHEVLRPTEVASTLSATGGNLTATAGVIVVTTPTQVSVFPQARTELEELTESLSVRGLSADDQLQAAMLHLVLDDRSTAQKHLEEVLANPGEADAVGDLIFVIRLHAARLLRELLFAQLNEAADPRMVLDKIEQLPGDEFDRLRLLVSRVHVERQLGNAERLIAAVDELRKCDGSVMVAPNGDADYQVRVTDLVADQLAAILSERRPDLVASLDDYVAGIVADTGRSADGAEIGQLLKCFDVFPQVADLRNAFAESCIAAGRLQQAELLLLHNRKSSNYRAAADAGELLIELYSHNGFIHEAAAILQELADEVSDFDDWSAGEVEQKLGVGHPIRRIVERRVMVHPAYNVQITEHLCDENCGDAGDCPSILAIKQHDRIRRKFHISDDSTVTVIDKGITKGDRSQSQLSLINRETGDFAGQIEVPSAYWQLSAAGEGHCGQLLPVCGRSAHGISLLEHRAVWSTFESGDASTGEKVKVGPIGNDFCVLQSMRSLSVIDPATGTVRWIRDDQSPCIGLMGNEGTGIIGNSETLTIFDADQLGYTVYRMRTGRRVRTGRLDLPLADARRHRRAVGGKLIHLASDESGDRLRIWDSATDRMLLDEPLRDRLFSPIGDCREYALINRAGELAIVDVMSGEICIRQTLSEEHLSDVGDLHVTSDPDRYYVNLVGCSDRGVTESVAAMDEVELPRMRVQGQLLAVALTGELEWSRPVEEAALLTHTQCRLPILVLVSRRHDAQQRQSANLCVEVLDVRTGQSLARNDGLMRTRIVQADHRTRPGCLTLIGLDSQISIEYAVPARQMLIHAEIEPETTTR